MTGTHYDLRPAAPTDRAVVRSMLMDARLPVEDLDEAAQVTFLVARSDSKPVGAIGLERYQEIGLLRSLVVEPEHRLRGLGRDLVRALEQQAKASGIVELVLLTETAEPFFRHLGYSAVARDLAPAVVTRSAEFRTLCPTTAVCMIKRLTVPRAG